jgi:Uma2 family endonuclease
MSATWPVPITLEAFLDWERGQDLRYEFDGFDAVAMNGGTIEHATIGSNLEFALRGMLHGTACRAVRNDLKIIVLGRVRYPDVVVTCSPIPRAADIVPNPVVVFEITSKSTAHTDRVMKRAEYGATASIMHYVMLEQQTMQATVLSRRAGEWVETVIRGDGIVRLPEIGVELPMAPLYAGVELDPAS